MYLPAQCSKPEAAVHERIGGDVLHLDQRVHHRQLVIVAKHGVIVAHNRLHVTYLKKTMIFNV